jgi:type IV secretory pathway VirB10-like protein
MNSIWLKIAGVAVVAIVVMVVIGRFKSDKPASSPPAETKQAEKPKTVYDSFERDKQFAKVPPQAEAQPGEEQAAAATPPAPQPPQPVVQAPAQPPADNYVMPSAITHRMQLYFKELSEEDKMQAQQLLSWAATTRSIDRLPMMASYGNMVRSCRDVISRWPESAYAFRAKQLLEDISTSSRARSSNITRKDMDITPFLKPKPGLQPTWVEPVQK